MENNTTAFNTDDMLDTSNEQVATEQNYSADGITAVHDEAEAHLPAFYEAGEAGEMGDGSAGDVITDINELDLLTEAPETDVDEDKLLDRLEYAPQLQAGKSYNFIFGLNKDKPVEGRKMKDKIIPQFNYELTLLKDDGSTGKTIRFLRADTFKTGKMETSRAEELLFALGMISDYKASDRKAKAVHDLLTQADAAGVTVRGVVHWQRYDKATKQRWSTSPQKDYTRKDGTTAHEEMWPRDAQGKFIQRPDGWDGNYGSETVTRVMPNKDYVALRKKVA